MNSIRAFISGIALPSVILPIFLCFAVYFQREELLNVLFVHILPLLWGVWNVLYFAVCREKLPGDENAKLLVTGASLGLIVAIIGVFWAGIPSIIGLEGNAAFFPLIAVPVIYALLWRYIVKPLNDIVGVKSD